MEWVHKNIRISINTEGRFFFNVGGKDFSTTSLDEESAFSIYTFSKLKGFIVLFIKIPFPIPFFLTYP